MLRGGQSASSTTLKLFSSVAKRLLHRRAPERTSRVLFWLPETCKGTWCTDILNHTILCIQVSTTPGATPGRTSITSRAPFTRPSSSLAACAAAIMCSMPAGYLLSRISSCWEQNMLRHAISAQVLHSGGRSSTATSRRQQPPKIAPNSQPPCSQLLAQGQTAACRGRPLFVSQISFSCACKRACSFVHDWSRAAFRRSGNAFGLDCAAQA